MIECGPVVRLCGFKMRLSRIQRHGLEAEHVVAGRRAARIVMGGVVVHTYNGRSGDWLLTEEPALRNSEGDVDAGVTHGKLSGGWSHKPTLLIRLH